MGATGTEFDAEYGADQIQILEGLEAVRKRPGMYIGSTSGRGLHHLVYEIVDNAVDEAINGFGKKITIVLENDGSVSVSDQGRGMPIGKHPSGKNTLEVIFTVLHAGGKFGGGAYKYSGGLHGVGASVVNALSSWLEVHVYHDGKEYYLRFENGGHPVGELKEIGTCDENKHGSVVKFLADPTIFTETTIYEHEIIRDRLRQLAFLNKDIRLTLTDKIGRAHV